MIRKATWLKLEFILSNDFLSNFLSLLILSRVEKESLKTRTSFYLSKLFILHVNYFALLLVPSNQQGRRVPSASPASPAQNVGNRRPQSPSPQPSPQPGASRGQPRPPKDEEEDDDEDSEPEEKFVCPRADGLYADPGSCKKFYLCGSWHAWAQSCPPSLYFDDRLKFCTFKTAQLACGPLNEEEVKEEEAQTNQDNLPYCDQRRCQLPNCFCTEEGTQIPG